ncbi:MAG: hypothetical protein MUD02_01885 [Bacteroidales bacterium]|nr:hypothetical protein [Bacteroidales bacterium]
MLLSVLLSVSCESDMVTYTSIEGSWRCEEYNPYTGNSIYTVDIDRSKNDTSVYLISNFHNLDFEEFAYSRKDGLELNIPDQVIESVRIKSGKGDIADDFTEIVLVYEISDGQYDGRVEAKYLRPQ